MMDYIKIKAPATAANLGAGFDVFVFNVGSASTMVVGMMRNDLKLIGESMQNRVIESVRARLVLGYLDVRNSALRAGAF
jgi:homoserine kinase